DAAARAAGGQFLRTGSPWCAREAATQAGARNPVQGKSVLFAEADIELGTALRPVASDRHLFAVTDVPANAVRIQGIRTAQTPEGGERVLLASLPNIADPLGSVHTAVVGPVDLDMALVLDRSDAMALSAGADGENSAAWRSCEPVSTNS